MQIKAHEWFKTMDWDKLYAKKLPAPFKPSVTGDDDTMYVHGDFLQEPVLPHQAVMQISRDSGKTTNHFANFSYRKKSVAKAPPESPPVDAVKVLRLDDGGGDGDSSNSTAGGGD